VAGRGGDLYDNFIYLRDRINELFAEREARAARSVSNDAPAWVPPVDILETPQTIEVRAELCGVKQQELNVEITGDSLTIAGVRQSDVEQGERLRRAERQFGPFRRSFALGVHIDPDAARARLANGTLVLTLPKAERHAPGERRVDIE